MSKWIIESLLDSDLYKYTMQQIVFHRFSDVKVEFEFKLRNYPAGTLVPYIDDIIEQTDHLCYLRFKDDELKYLKSSPFISDSYIEFLRNFQLNRNNIDIYRGSNGFLTIHIHGNWLNTILFEVPILAIVSEVFSKHQQTDENCAKIGEERLKEKIKLLKEFNKDKTYSLIKIADFGTRRRYTRNWQEYVIKTLSNEVHGNFVGTSNVLFAKKYNIKSIGTMAHEYIQAMQALVRLSDSQKYAFENWVQEYRGRLGIALSDTLGFDAFLNDFDLYFSKLFDGARHDSGDPYEWGEKLINHYLSMTIDPKTKTAVFSDGLNINKAIDLHKHFSKRINTSFGIGTNLTNDVGIKPMQIVIKMTKCNNQPVSKISDSPGKQMCIDNEYLKYLSSVFKIKRDNLFK